MRLTVACRASVHPVPVADRESHLSAWLYNFGAHNMTIGRPIDKDLRKQIAGLLRQGKSQAEIGRIIDRAPGTVAHYVRALGFAPKEYTTPAAVVKGKRRCASCGKRKSIGAYPNDRGADCTMCIRAKKGS
jgi:hypothetical protein